MDSCMGELASAERKKNCEEVIKDYKDSCGGSRLLGKDSCYELFEVMKYCEEEWGDHIRWAQN